MLLYDFTEYIKEDELPNYRRLKDNLDIFRKEYPRYVRRRARCFHKVYANPKKWKFYVERYKMSPTVFMEIGHFRKLTIKCIIQNKQRWLL